MPALHDPAASERGVHDGAEDPVVVLPLHDEDQAYGSAHDRRNASV